LAIIKGPETKFNEVYIEYDKWRPTYVVQLYKDMMDFKEINESSNVLEIGIGTGQATLPILETGCSLTAVELGDKLAAYTKQKFSEYHNFNIKCTAFQDFEGQEGSFDVIYSASAFHWIPEEIGYPKVFKMLKSGGTFARFANHPYYRKGNEELYIAMQKVYSKYMPYSPPAPEYSEEQCRERADISTKYGFIDVKYRLYHRIRTFNAQEYVSLIGTYSNHNVLEQHMRAEFLHEIQHVIEDFGNKITIYDTIDLQLARKP